MREEIIEWKKKVAFLDIIEIKLEKSYKEKKISKKKREEIKKQINKAWIQIWNLYPDQNPLAKEFFELHFGQWP